MTNNGQVPKLKQILKLLTQSYGQPEVKREGALKTLVRTILSQNTNDENRDKAMTKLLDKYDNYSKIIDSPKQELKEVIAVAGLNNRKSKALKRSLKQIKEERGGLDPDLSFLAKMRVEESEKWLRNLYGVGPKTARIVLLFEFGKPVFPVDTHCERVLKRTGYVKDKLSAEKVGNRVQAELTAENLIALHLNLIKHGRRICKAQEPFCNQCPLLTICDFGRDRVKSD